ncbi:MAG: SDR family NAD(P)-dependent oxidoreductase [Bradyrhizobium sp.]|jgi:NAD(P)-dependent dehydrogenase (short-subunit alcohol dehydrogenase family)
MSAIRPFAIVTGASTGIGFELAKRCVKEGYDLLIAADEPVIEKDRNVAWWGWRAWKPSGPRDDRWG